MHKLLVLFLTGIFLYIFFFKTKNSIFEFSWKNKRFFSIIMARELLVGVLLGVLLVEFLPSDAVFFHHATQESKNIASIFILYAIIAFILSLVFFSRIFFSKYFENGLANKCKYSINLVREKLVLFSVLSMLFVLVIVMHGLGMKHAFISSIIDGYDLLDVRLANRYHAGVPTILMSYLSFLSLLASSLLGVIYRDLQKKNKYLSLFLIVYSTLLLGGKFPLLSNFMAFYLGYLSQIRGVPLRKIVFKVLFMVVVCLFLLFLLLRVQYSEVNAEGFGNYLLGRVGVGQIQGVYEEFGLKLSNTHYVWHAVSFAKYALDVKIERFNKDLMMNTFGMYLDDETELGVMNSLFVGEAFAIGGVPLVIISPFLVSFNYIIIVATVMFVFRRFFGIPSERSTFVIQVFVPSFVALTGDINGLLFFKTNIMVLIFFFPIISIYMLLRNFSKASHSRKVGLGGLPYTLV